MLPTYAYDVKEDEEQNKKLIEIVELLVASGYFRARIKGLSPFDKVVGGMVWCISVCSYDIDVDLLFQENDSIGQKIALTEKIVEVLKEMKCTHHLEPHQIQGLDFIHIFSVVQWLVKKVIESRKGKEDVNRSQAVSEFNRIHSIVLDSSKEKRIENALSTLNKVRVQPERKFKRVDELPSQDENQQVRYTLLEYGKRQYFMDSSTTSADQKSAKHSERSEADSLYTGLSFADPKQDVVSLELVGLIVNRQSQAMSEIMSNYDDKAKHLKHTSSVTQADVKNLAVLNKQFEILENNLTSFKGQRDALKEDLEKAQADLKMVLEENSSLIQQIQKECIDDCQEQKKLAELEKLVTLNDNLKKQETELRSNCMAEKKRMENMIEELVGQDNLKEEVEKKQMIKTEMRESLEKFGKLRLILARKNREISALRWKIDNIPSREELHQYQCRFIELHKMVMSKHKETKQFFTKYNSLDDKRLYLEKEVGLYNSILENFEKAMSSESHKTAFMRQLEQIVEGVKQNKLKLERKQQEVKANKAQLQEKVSEIIEKERMYFKVVKDFQEECNKNEVILVKLQKV